MKHTLKKLLASSLVLALVAGMLVGCGGAPSSSAANSTSASVEATSSAGGKGENPNAGRENVTIRFSQYANNTDDQEYMANDPIKKAIEEAVNVTIEYDTGIEGYDDRLATELAVGAAPDLFPPGAWHLCCENMQKKKLYMISAKSLMQTPSDTPFCTRSSIILHIRCTIKCTQGMKTPHMPSIPSLRAPIQTSTVCLRTIRPFWRK